MLEGVSEQMGMDTVIHMYMGDRHIHMCMRMYMGTDMDTDADLAQHSVGRLGLPQDFLEVRHELAIGGERPKPK